MKGLAVPKLLTAFQQQANLKKYLPMRIPLTISCLLSVSVIKNMLDCRHV